MNMIRFALVLLALVLSASACSKYDRYERNVVFFSDRMLDQEINVRREALSSADRALAEVSASGDKERIAKARSADEEARLALTIAEDEKVFRETGHRPLRGPNASAKSNVSPQ